jgi:hypothetical protein
MQIAVLVMKREKEKPTKPLVADLDAKQIVRSVLVVVDLVQVREMMNGFLPAEVALSVVDAMHK